MQFNIEQILHVTLAHFELRKEAAANLQEDEDLTTADGAAHDADEPAPATH